MSHRVTGSRTDLAESGCLYWARPDVAVPEDVSGVAAEQGIRLHALAEEYSENGAITGEVADDIAARWVQLRDWLDGWREHVSASLDAFAERAFKLDVNTGSVTDIPRDAGRDYGHSDTEIPARLDLGAVWPDFVEVWDLKTGETAVAASQSGQLRTLAAMTCKTFNKPKAVVHIVHVRDDSVHVDSHPLDAMDLDAHEFKMRNIIASIPGALPKTGTHCRWCPARTTCPAIETAMVSAPSMAIGSAEDVARIWPLLKPIEDALEAIKARAKEVVNSQGEVPLVNGRRLRIVRSGGGESVDIKALAKAVGEDGMNRFRANGVVKKRAQGSYVKETA